ncbi:MAG: hypothetical protein JNK82_19400, partial [Myxococcaceae bacterium]|nr:hypothetical protein [Myxococcaceae bacterium]
MALLPVAVVVALLFCACSSTPAADAGTAGGSATAGGSGGAAGGSEAEVPDGGDVYLSPDGRARLFVQPGSAPRDAGIRLTVNANDAGTVTVTLEPSGLVFSTPAVLAVTTPGWEDGKVATLPASLDGERVRSVHVTAGALEGITPGVALVKVAHFSEVTLGQQNGPFPWVEAEL